MLLRLSTFVHELGHNLSLTHGNLFDNSEDYPFKPNLPSVMNYRYQLKGVDTDCDLDGDGLYTYSPGTLAATCLTSRCSNAASVRSRSNAAASEESSSSESVENSGTDFSHSFFAAVVICEDVI